MKKGKMNVLNSLLHDITLFKSDSRGLGENAIQETIASYPINAKHYLFYNQYFNGGDCMPLMVNWILLFIKIEEAYQS